MKMGSRISPQVTVGAMDWTGSRVGAAMGVSGAAAAAAATGLSTPSIEVTPAGKLCSLWATHRPAAHKLTALGERDTLHDGTRLFALTLDYLVDFDAPLATAVSDCVPRWPALNAQLYESPFCAQLCLAFGPGKRLLYAGDAWPKDRYVLN